MADEKTPGQQEFERHFAESMCFDWDGCSDDQKAVWEEVSAITGTGNR